MRYHSKIGLAMAVSALLFGGASAWAGDRARIDTGEIAGVTADGIISFKGLPYAQPPVGALRWRPPQPAAAWSGVRPADAYGAICRQKVIKDNGVGLQPASEDCLTLNVFAPAGTAAGAKLPVMVWIHGGGLVNGSSGPDLYDGSKLAAQGVVVVTINYRLGRFGFFAHPALTAEAAGGDVANDGLMDQIAALQWVQRNIAALGGDPKNVTAFGESAGGLSINRLMMIPQAAGLFQKAIVQSGVGRERGQTLAEAEVDGAAFAKSLGASGDAASLRALSADAIVAAGELDIGKGEAPILDGHLLKEPVIDAFRAGRIVKIPYMVGSNSLELPGAFAPPSLKALVRLSPEQKAKAVAAYGSEAAYNDHIISDVVFGEPARALAKAHATDKPATYLYRFSVVSSGAPKMLTGAVHASDRQYVFQTLSAAPWPADARDAALAKTISAYWVAFAKTGDPNGPGRPVWPLYDAGDRLINFTNDGPVAEKTPDAVALDAIAGSYP